jgi:2-phosphosulfolactate phosphatase
MQRTVVIDCFRDSVEAYRNGYAIVAVDVLRATTTATTAIALGRRCFPVPSIDAATRLAGTLRAAGWPDPLLVGELGGCMPYGFDLNNSPSALEARSDVHRPMILLSTSGTSLICAAGEAQAVYVACLRNYRAQAAHLAAHHPTIAVIGAGTRGEFREEDQLCCAWMAEELLRAGYEPEDARTAAMVERWSGASVAAIIASKSAAYLRRRGQHRDLEFVLTHVDDLDCVYRYVGAQVVPWAARSGASRARADALVRSLFGAIGEERVED